MFRTARQRLVAWNVLVLIFILVFLGVAVYESYSANLYKEVDQQLKAQEFRVLERLNLYGGEVSSLRFLEHYPFEPAYRTLVMNANGQIDFSSDCPTAPQIIPTLQYCPVPGASKPASEPAIDQALVHGQDIRTVSFRGEPQRVLTFPITFAGTLSGVIQISRSVAPEQNALNELGRLLLFGGLFGIVLSGLGSFFLATRAFVPIRQAFARQRQFTADASHELRTPLALIRANAEMLCRHADRLPAGDDELIGEIVRETDHLNRLISDLLTLARSDSERVPLPTKPVDFRALVSAVHEDLEHIARSRGIESHISLDGPLTVQGDEIRLRQLLLILLDNALKYTDAGGRVDISLQREDGRVRLQVSDTGIGIPAEDLPHIFDRFYRVDRAREHESGGTGLGLAIAQWIVQAHHGSIKVESQVGRGTRFQVELPAR